MIGIRINAFVMYVWIIFCSLLKKTNNNIPDASNRIKHAINQFLQVFFCVTRSSCFFVNLELNPIRDAAETLSSSSLLIFSHSFIFVCSSCSDSCILFRSISIFFDSCCTVSYIWNNIKYFCSFVVDLYIFSISVFISSRNVFISPNILFIFPSVDKYIESSI